MHVQVSGASSIRIGQSKSELMQSYGTVQQGQVIAAADGTQRFWWRGELWVISDSGDALVDFQFA